MKKISVILILLFLLVGCSPTQDEKIENICLLGNNYQNDGKVLICFKDYQVKKELNIGYPIKAYYQDNWLYYSIEEGVYESVNILDYSLGRTIETDANIMCVCDNGNIIVDDNVTVAIINENKEMIMDYDIQVVDYIIYKDCFYLLDQTGLLRTLSKKDGTLLYSNYVNLENGNQFTIINDTLFLASSIGITEIENGDVTITYLYSITPEALQAAYQDVVYLIIDSSTIPFRLTINGVKVEMEMLTDPMYYTGIDYAFYFKKYYEEEYYCIYDFPNS